ncbi:hypothetical protein J437_LFUL019323 [Ladona fulva]|uniref:TGF-beta family profile domain-containing protein n=1 Tax=Ladona fulva TaxID=123851 RepID=A0A8K0P8A8_LADFU|nr:hypothetical protein J437_LFUL019323 [Ladona fulva]
MSELDNEVDYLKILSINARHGGRTHDSHIYRELRVINFLSEKILCMPASQDPSACFTFRLPAELEAEDVTVAQLWFYKERDRLDNHNQTLVISEVALWDRNRSYQKTKLLAIESTSIKDYGHQYPKPILALAVFFQERISKGWIKVNLLWVVKHWLENLELPHAVQIACKTCGTDVPKSPISLLPENKPFLVINTNSNSAKRPQRNINCAPGLTECCRESLYISFAEIGWDDWILQPPGYHAYFCKGSCSVASSITQSGSHYSSIMQVINLYFSL